MFQVVDPTVHAGWDDLVLSHSGCSIFHSSSWADVLRSAYGFSPHYILSVVDSRLTFALPLFEIRSVLTGRRGVSLPFSDYCDPLSRDDGSPFDALPWVFDYGKKRGWSYVELRVGDDLPDGFSPSETYFRHELELDRDPNKLLKSFRNSTVRNIQKATKSGVVARIDASHDGVKEFYRLNCLTRREHGLPPQPYRFFSLLHDRLISKGRGFVVLAEEHGTAIAANVYLHFGDRAFYKYGASDKRFQDLRAANLVMWEAIKRYATTGFRSLCFGKTELFQDGLRQFKTGWGTRESKIHYLRYDLGSGKYVESSSRVRGFHNHFFRAMPVIVSRAIGAFLYRHTA